MADTSSSGQVRKGRLKCHVKNTKRGKRSRSHRQFTQRYHDFEAYSYVLSEEREGDDEIVAVGFASPCEEALFSANGTQMHYRQAVSETGSVVHAHADATEYIRSHYSQDCCIDCNVSNRWQREEE